MTYLSCLKPTENAHSIRTKLRLLELQNNLFLPPIFKAFFETFDTNLVDSAFLPFFSDNHPFLCDFSGGNEIPPYEMIYKIFSLDEMFEIKKAVYAKDNESSVVDLLPFAECPLQGYLMVGVGNQNQDQIFIEYAHREPRILKVGENVISFLGNIRVVPDESRLPKGVTLSSLFRNWGEDFWRIRQL